jgi:hypothetical protein
MQPLIHFHRKEVENPLIKSTKRSFIDAGLKIRPVTTSFGNKENTVLGDVMMVT